MRIGDFAKKHDVSVDTIRYYLSLQLLLAEKDGSQYRFTDEDSKDMEEILELKELKFSLEEIKNILTYKRLTSGVDNTFIQHYRKFLQDKKEEILTHKEELDEALHYINGKIHEEECGIADVVLLGLPIKILDKIACPNCKSEIHLTEGHIEKNMIISGKFNCSCGKSLLIDNGIIINEESIKEKALPSKQEYYEKTSPKFINFLFKSMSSLINIINDDNVKKDYILEISNCCGFFLINYLPNLDRESTYIIVDHDLNRLRKLKCDLETNHKHDKFVFICTDYDKLPLKKESMDLVLDCFVTYLHGENNGELISKYFYPMVSRGGKYGGIYTYFDSGKKDIPGIPSHHREYYNKKKILNMLKNAGLKDIDIRINGPVEEGGEYNPYVEGNNYCNLIYLGE